MPVVPGSIQSSKIRSGNSALMMVFAAYISPLDISKYLPIYHTSRNGEIRDDIYLQIKKETRKKLKLFL
jgi:hypothetical protein